jgi:hypothetical protein
MAMDVRSGWRRLGRRNTKNGLPLILPSQQDQRRAADDGYGNPLGAIRAFNTSRRSTASSAAPAWSRP